MTITCLKKDTSFLVKVIQLTLFISAIDISNFAQSRTIYPVFLLSRTFVKISKTFCNFSSQVCLFSTPASKIVAIVLAKVSKDSQIRFVCSFFGRIF